MDKMKDQLKKTASIPPLVRTFMTFTLATLSPSIGILFFIIFYGSLLYRKTALGMFTNTYLTLLKSIYFNNPLFFYCPLSGARVFTLLLNSILLEIMLLIWICLFIKRRNTALSHALASQK